MTGVTEDTKILVYSFYKAPKKGFGARIYDILNAFIYSQSVGAELKFNNDEKWLYTTSSWFDVFSSEFPKTLATKDQVANQYNLIVWPAMWDGTSFKKESEEHYATSLAKLYRLNPQTQAYVNEMVAKSGFVDSDIVIHLRMSDKTKQEASNISVAESAEQDLTWYSNEVLNFCSRVKLFCDESQINQTTLLPRIFLCSDSPDALTLMQKLLPNFEITWDVNEYRHNGFIPLAWSDKLSETQMKEEMFNCLKNLEIMKRCIFLIGARASYFFRVAELLRFPGKSVNVKDSDVFGAAEYSTYPPVRPCRIKSYLNCVNPQDFTTFSGEMKNTGMVTIPNFFNPTLAENIYEFLHNSLPDSWLDHSIKYNGLTDVTFLSNSDPSLKFHTDKAKQCNDEGYFSYHFKRSHGEHFNTCSCAICRLQDTTGSFEFLNTMSLIVGENVSSTGETFLSKYQKGHFLNVHHDKDKGKYAFVLSFNKNWNVAHGGLLHFINHNNTPNATIYKTCIPSFNTLTLFKLPADQEQKVDHFVSEVTSDKSRISFTGWLK